MINRQKRNEINEIVDVEQGTRFSPCASWIALGYPAPYAIAASSLGYQTVYRLLNAHPSLSCERFVYSDEAADCPVTLESRRPIVNANAIAFSLACETDFVPVIRMLNCAGISPLANERSEKDLPIIAGGPLSLLSPRLLSPLADVVVCGEGEDALPVIADALVEAKGKTALLDLLSKAENIGIWVPSRQPCPVSVHFVDKTRLPAFAATWSPLADFRNLYLVEIARGCPRQCAFCLLAKTGRFRPVSKDVILSKIPDAATGVGLVGAAVTDHPQLGEIVSQIVASGRRVSLSSMRADRLTPTLLSDLVRGGLRTLTVAADGSSEQLRSAIRKGITQEHLINAARMAREQKLKGLKLYSMVGLPNETDGDIDEFVRLMSELSSIIRLTVAVQSFVPKPNTPLADEPMLDIKQLKQRLNRFQRMMKGRVVIQSTSPRWSWVDWKLAHAAEQAVSIAIDADLGGGDFSAWKRAISGKLSR